MNRQLRHLDFLDLLRGVAILAVFCFHGLDPAFGFEHLPWVHGVRQLTVTRTFLAVLPCCLGWAGVAIFFAVSGFCIHLSFTRQAAYEPVRPAPPDQPTPPFHRPYRPSGPDRPGPWRDFFVRRFFRIYPPYLAALLLFAGVWPHIPVAVLPPPDPTDLWSHVFLLHNFTGHTFYGINPAYWSIAVEAQLYLLYPLWLTLARRFSWTATLCATAIIELTLRLTSSDIYTIYPDWSRLTWQITTPLTFWFSWGLGAAAAEFYLHGQFPKLFRTPFLLWLTLAITTYFIRPLAPLSFPLFSFATCTAIARFLDGRWSLTTLPSHLASHLTRVGVWSYSIYLLHQPLMSAVPILVHRCLPKATLPPILLFALCLSTWPLIVALGAGFHRFIEQPAIAWGKRCLPSPRSAPVTNES